MGSWNKTCGVSGLPIFDGDPVLVVALEQNVLHDRCYASAFWKPVLVPFYAEYNDYGSGEDNTGAGVDLLLNGLRSQLVEQDEGENKYHENAVYRADFELAHFYKATKQGRLKVKDFMGFEAAIDFTMIRADVADHILNNYYFETYQDKGCKKITYADCISAVGQAIEVLSSEDDDALRPFRQSAILSKCSVPLQVALNSISSTQCSGLIHALDAVRQSSTVEEATDIVSSWVKLSFIDSFLDSIRKHWSPQAFEGSQEGITVGYEVLTGAIDSICKKINDEND
jgi:hypothetical protein